MRIVLSRYLLPACDSFTPIRAGVDKVAAHVADAVSKGAQVGGSVELTKYQTKSQQPPSFPPHNPILHHKTQVLTGGKPPSLPAPYDAGTFFEPTVLSGATIDMRCFSEETFGPLLPIFK